MNYVLLLCLLVGIFSSVGKAWECSSHLIMMQIALRELTADEKGKMERILGGMNEHDANFTILEAACFHEDMTASGFTGLDSWKSYETPYYEGISEKDATYTKPHMDTLYAIVR